MKLEALARVRLRGGSVSISLGVVGLKGLEGRVRHVGQFRM